MDHCLRHTGLLNWGCASYFKKDHLYCFENKRKSYFTFTAKVIHRLNNIPVTKYADFSEMESALRVFKEKKEIPECSEGIKKAIISLNKLLDKVNPEESKEAFIAIINHCVNDKIKEVKEFDANCRDFDLVNIEKRMNQFLGLSELSLREKEKYFHVGYHERIQVQKDIVEFVKAYPGENKEEKKLYKNFVIRLQESDHRDDALYQISKRIHFIFKLEALHLSQKELHHQVHSMIREYQCIKEHNPFVYKKICVMSQFARFKEIGLITQMINLLDVKPANLQNEK